MPQTKATKKFEKKHLGQTIKHRNEAKKFKQREQLKAKKKARRVEDNPGSAAAEDAKAKQRNVDTSALNSISVDDFFSGGFEIPQKPKKKKGAQTKIGKRKRTPIEDKDEGAESSAEESDNGVEPVASDSEAGNESDGVADDHKDQLAALSKKDPEFFKYLQQNEPELLDFDEDADLAALDMLSADEDETTPRKRQKKGGEESEDEREVTQAMVKKWSAAMTEKHSLRSSREVVLAFRSAVHADEDDTKTYRYTVSDSDVYHSLLVASLKQIPEVIEHHLPVKETASGKIRLPSDAKKIRNISPLIRTYMGSVLHLLGNLSDAATIKMTLNAIRSLIPYLLSFKKLLKEIIRNVVSIWADSSNTEATRIAAFLVLRRLTVVGDAGTKEAVLKATYQGLVKGSRNTTVHTIQGVNLMKNSAAELWGIDPSIGYTTGFTFIRQLAVHLRSSITNKSKESYKTVYNWQYVHSLDFWSRVLALHCDSLREAESGKPSPLRPLIYPVVQVTLGAARLIPTAQYFPLRFQLVRSMLRITLATGTYVPMASTLYEVLNSAEMKKPPKASTLKALDFNTSIRATSAYLRTRVYQDGVGEQVTELLSEFLVQWTKSVAFPELALAVIVMLKRWLKDVSSKSRGNMNGKINAMIALLVQKLEANSKWIEEKRTKVDFAPRDRAGVEGFLKDVEWDKSPLGAYVNGQRKTREEKAKIIEEARKADEKSKKEDREEKQRQVKEQFDTMNDEVEDDEVDLMGSDVEEDEEDGEDEDMIDGEEDEDE